MLKKFLFTGFFYLLFVISFSQTISHQRKEDLSIKKFHQAVISINSPEYFISIPVSSISVVDARPDSWLSDYISWPNWIPGSSLPRRALARSGPIHKKICALLEIRFVFSSHGIKKILDFDKRA